MKVRHFHTKMPCKKPMLRKLNGKYKIDLSQRMDFCHWLLYFSKNLIWLWEPLINNWCNVPIAQIHIHIFCKRFNSIWGCVFPVSILKFCLYYMLILPFLLAFAHFKRDTKKGIKLDSLRFFLDILRHKSVLFFLYSFYWKI